MNKRKEKQVENVRDDVNKIANWHITLFIFLIMQTCAAVWWASNVSASIEYLKQNAKSNREQLDSRMSDIYQRISRLEDNILKNRI